MIDEKRFYEIEDLEDEQWAPIEGFPDYEISTYGRVCSYKGKNQFCDKEETPHLLKINNKKNNYCHINLWDQENKRKTLSIHRLVAKTFIPNSNNLPVINHKDENPSNNHIDNLEWCTTKYNINYGTRAEKEIKTKLKTGNCIPVKCLETGEIFYSQIEAERKLNICKGIVSKSIKNKRKYCGYTFEKVDPNSSELQNLISEKIFRK